MYGARETSPLDDAMKVFQAKVHASGITVDWTDKRLARIVRLRLLTDPGFPVWDVSYCHGELRDGTAVRVSLPFSQLPKRAVSRTIVAYAIKDGVNAKRLGVFDAIATLI